MAHTGKLFPVQGVGWLGLRLRPPLRELRAHMAVFIST